MHLSNSFIFMCNTVTLLYWTFKNLLKMMKQWYVKALYRLFHFIFNNQRSEIQIAKYQTLRNLINFFTRGLEKLHKKAATTRNWLAIGFALMVRMPRLYVCLWAVRVLGFWMNISVQSMMTFVRGNVLKFEWAWHMFPDVFVRLSISVEVWIPWTYSLSTYTQFVRLVSLIHQTNGRNSKF